MKTYEYILRLAIAPDFFEDEKIAAMVEFCKAARIDDVMFHLNCEELNQGHLSIEETRPWMRVIQKAGQALKEIGVTMSINPWTTTLHTDRGRLLNPGLTFKTMVDPLGNQASACACPLDKDFRKYLTEMYAFYAQAHPRMLWVEDDFRLHNHAPLVWGGCFCETHMAEYSRRAGKTLTREEFVQGLLQPGEPHPYRKIWLDVARETMATLAEEIGKAVHAVSPETLVGLMSSAPSVHCAEGRDWEGILRGLAGEENPPVNRPHLPAYQDVAPQMYCWNFALHSRQTKAAVPADTLIYPELEGFPHTTFSKSNTFLAFQLTTSLLLGADGITLNIFDMMGNGTVMSDGYHKTLAKTKDFLNAVRSLDLTRKTPLGVKVMLNPLSSYSIHTPEGRSMEELYPDEGFFAGLLTAYGISNHYCLDQGVKGEIIAISGQYLRGCTKEEIERLFHNNKVLMNGEAASTLFELGMGHLAGISDVKWHPQDDGSVCYEQVCDGQRYHGLPAGRMSAQNTGDFLEIRYSVPPYLFAEAKDYLGQTSAPGMAMVENRVFILPYKRSNGRPDALLNPLRRDILHAALYRFADSAAAIVAGCAPVSALAWREKGKTWVLLTNWSYDEIDKSDKLSMILQNIKFDKVSEISSEGEKELQFTRKEDFVLLETGLRSAETKVLIFEEN